MTNLEATAVDHLITARGELARALEQVSRRPEAVTDLISARRHADEVAEYTEAIGNVATDHAATYGPTPWSGWVLTLVADLRILLAGLFAVLASKPTP